MFHVKHFSSLYMTATTTNVDPSELNYDSYERDVYDDDIRRSIPGHRDLHVALQDCVEKHVQHTEVSEILELGIGTGITSEVILSLIPEAHLTAIDFSEKMLSGAKERLSAYSVDYLIADYATEPFVGGFDIITSVIGIHHQNNEGKKDLFIKIHDSLTSGGMFIFGDLFTYNDKHKAALNDARHYHHLVEHARSSESMEEWAYHHKFLNDLAAIEDQVIWLRDVGFRKVKIVYEHMNTALIIARK